jgi:catechol 2,3-dioxygenase-like lactoylglutathione lyase family enzyme
MELARSKQFYVALGFQLVSEDDSCIVLEPPSRATTQPYLLIERVEINTEDYATRKEHCADAGYGRICIAVENVAKEIDRLRKLGFEPVAAAVTGRPGDPSERNAPVTIVAYSDPDENVVELVSMTGGAVAVLKTLKVLGVVRFPLWVHINANATSFEKTWEAYQQLGFTMNVDYKRVENQL